MKNTAEKIASSGQANVRALGGLMTVVYDGFEKVVELNMTLAKAAMAESFSYTQDLLGAKDPQELMALQASLAQPLAEKSVVYTRHVSAVATDIGGEFKKAVDARMAEAQATFFNLVDSVAKNAPAGSEPAVVVFKTAMNASQNLVDAARAATEKAAELLQANMAALVKKVGDVSGPSAARSH